MYVWKINMIDGSKFLVHSDECNIVKFIEAILPRNEKETISVFKCAKSYIDGECYKYDSVGIIGSKVSSVEYYVGDENE